MKIIAAFVVGLALVGVLPAAPATAGAARTFVSPTGSDSNLCTLVAPCRFFQAAFAQTNPGGEIAVLGTAGYNNGATFTINKAISIVNPGGFEAGIAVPSGGAGIVINAGASDAINLRGLTIEGGGVGNTGIEFDAGLSLNIENSVIRNLTALGVFFRPNVVWNTNLSISNSLVADNGNNGISVFPSGSAVVTAIFNRVEVKNNTNTGILVDGLNSTGTLKATVVDSVATNHDVAGFEAITALGHAPTTLMVVRSVSANNNGSGVFASGSGATIRVTNSTLTGNNTGWVASGGVVQSYGNNSIDGNTGNETAPPPIAQK
jgi:Right handed beta helix region